VALKFVRHRRTGLARSVRRNRGKVVRRVLGQVAVVGRKHASPKTGDSRRIERLRGRATIVERQGICLGIPIVQHVTRSVTSVTRKDMFESVVEDRDRRQR